MSVTCQRVAVLTLVAVAIQFLGLFLFVIGFFPVNPALSGVSGLESYEPGCHASEKPMENIPPDRLRSLYIVIDGLPAEFILGKGRMTPTKLMMEAMPHTQFLLSNGKAVGFHAKGAPPTVTMPRLKAMTSGAIPGFLDVAYNFNTQALLDDNILGQLSRTGWQMVMHGDETWLRLFPGLFIRQDAVSSFYVMAFLSLNIMFLMMLLLFYGCFNRYVMMKKREQKIAVLSNSDIQFFNSSTPSSYFPETDIKIHCQISLKFLSTCTVAFDG